MGGTVTSSLLNGWLSQEGQGSPFSLTAPPRSATCQVFLAEKWERGATPQIKIQAGSQTPKTNRMLYVTELELK